jgi:hypothetical protein
MVDQPTSAIVRAVAACVALAAAGGPAAAQANFKCDPLDPVADVGWAVVPSLETVGKLDSTPFQSGPSGDWFITRTTTLLPFCNYYNEIGIYSMRSYTLSRQTSEERVQICKATPAGGAAVAPYAGPCPPR